MSIRTYNPSVRVGNWNEDLCLEEDLLKDFLEKKEAGELLIHKSRNLVSKLLKNVALSPCKDGRIHFGDVICLYNSVTETTLSINLPDICLHEDDSVFEPCGLSSSKILEPTYRNAFRIVSIPENENQVGDYLTYGQHFALVTLPGVGGDLKLASESSTFMKNAKKSRLQEVWLQSKITYQCHWQILHFDPRLRMEFEGCPVMANTEILVNHCKTNQRLCAHPDYLFRTAFGLEHEVVAHTFFDSHKAEKKENHWVLIAYDNQNASKEDEVVSEQQTNVQNQ